MRTHRAGRRITMVAAGAVLVAGAASAGCGSGRGSGEGAAAAPPRYEVAATVLDSGTGPQLCAGGVALSLPPQCSGPQVSGWDWEIAIHEEVGGVRWGGYHLVGTWDGTTFTVTEPPSPSDDGGGPSAEELDFSAPCPEPDGGWPVVAGLTLEQQQGFLAAAQAPPDFAGMWVDAPSGTGDPGRWIYTVAYTGDLDAHRADLQAIWPGPICVVQFPRTLTELQAIQQEVTDRAQAGELDLHLLWSGIDEVHGRVQLGVLVDDRAAVADLDARYGPGVVELQPAMTAVE